MGEQLTMPLWPRQHDLPPRWDGLPVEWGEWSSTEGMFICPPPRDTCGRCGTVQPPRIALGRIWTDPQTAPAAIGRARLQRGRHLVAILSAFRCVVCEHDHVLDGDGQAWDLDETDYTDAGSWAVA